MGKSQGKGTGELGWGNRSRGDKEWGEVTGKRERGKGIEEWRRGKVKGHRRKATGREGRGRGRGKGDGEGGKGKWERGKGERGKRQGKGK